MNYFSLGRTNYVRISDEEGLEELLTSRVAGVTLDYDKEGRVCFLCGEEGGTPYFLEEGEEYTEFDWGTVIMPYVEPGEVLVYIHTGYEGMRYLGGMAAAYIKSTYGEIRQVDIGLNDIYEMAANIFEVPEESITKAEY